MLSIDGLLYDELTDDPSTPSEGQVWFNTTSHLYKCYRNSVVTSFTDKVAFDAHATSTSNPHTTTLEQARTAGNTLSGNIAMGNNKLTGLANPVDGTDSVNWQSVKSHVDSKLQGLDWQNSVINMIRTGPPVTPVTGDRYVVAATATGDWAGKENQIAEWSGTAWIFTVPNKGFTLNNEADDTDYNYNGSAWVNIGSSIPKGTPVDISDATNTQGAATSFAVSNHVHAHGSRGGGSLHALTSSSAAGFAPQTNRAATTSPGVGNDNTQGYVAGSRWTDTTAGTDWVCISVATGAAVWKETTNIAGILPQKSGKVLAASFAGAIKKYTVTFATAFVNDDYSAQVTPVTTGNKQFSCVVESQVAGSFVISIGSGSTTGLTQVNWHATKSGEST
jgi:hypothetical protein